MKSRVRLFPIRPTAIAMRLFKHILALPFAALLLAVCATQAARAAPPVLPPAATFLRSGLDVAGFDRTLRPADDFYRFVAGGWIEHTEIPADRPSWGSFDQLAALSEAQVHSLLEELAASPAPAGTNARRLGDFYRSFMDTERRARLGGYAGGVEGR